MTRSTRNGSSSPSDRVNPRPRKAARTNEPEPSLSPQATAPLVNTPSMTPMASQVMQDVAKMVDDILKKEREEMKSSFESFRLEMQQRMDELQKRHEAEIKALKESQDQVLDALKKEMATLAKGNESRGLDDQIQPAGNSSADDGATQSRASVSALPNSEKSQTVAPSQPKVLVTWKGTKLCMKGPEGWEPPGCTSTLPEMNELWPSRRGSKLSRHPLADCIPEGCQSAIERAMQQHNDGAKDGAKDGL